MKVVAIYDNGGKTIDRYTVITDEPEDMANLNDMFMELGMSDDPTYPTGFSQWGGVTRSADRYNYDNEQWRTRCDLGRLIRFESLPEHLQKHIAYRMWVQE